MQKLPVRKILSVLFFLILLSLIFILYKNNNTAKPDVNTLLIFGGLFFSAFFLLFFNLIKPISEKGSISSKEISNETREIDKGLNKDIQIQTKNHISEILKDTNNPANIKSLAELILRNFARDLYIVQGIFFIKNKKTNSFQSSAVYAFYSENEIKEFEEGDGISGQVALNKKPELITELAEGYITVLSGLGSSSPTNLLILPFVFNNETIAIAELAAFEDFPENINEIYSKINIPLSEKINSLI